MSTWLNKKNVLIIEQFCSYINFILLLKYNETLSIFSRFNWKGKTYCTNKQFIWYAKLQNYRNFKRVNSHKYINGCLW